MTTRLGQVTIDGVETAPSGGARVLRILCKRYCSLNTIPTCVCGRCAEVCVEMCEEVCGGVGVCGGAETCVCVCVWRCVGVCGGVWRCGDVCGGVWGCAEVRGGAEMCGDVWVCVEVCGEHHLISCIVSKRTISS